MPGYFQPVEIKAPEGVKVSLAARGTFLPTERTPIRAGMLIGQVYRLRVTEVPLFEGREVFPTIEVIDRLYPPLGMETRFPIPIELTREDLQLALRGRFVTRVIYLEEPSRAIPAVEGEHQNWYDVGPGRDPLRAADELGRPVAILRIGGRLPTGDVPDDEFLYGSPPFLRIAPRPNVPPRQPLPVPENGNNTGGQAASATRPLPVPENGNDTGGQAASATRWRTSE